jgi:uncharacterized protein
MYTQKIALFGTPGETTEFLIAEALRRGHSITLIVPDVREFSASCLSFKIVKGDARKREDVSKFSKGHDVVICAYETSQSNPMEHIALTRSLIEGVRDSGALHIVYAAHQFEQPSERTAGAYNEYKVVLKAQEEALKLLNNEKNIKWTYAHSIEPEEDEKTGNYPTIMEVLFTTSSTEYRIPMLEYTSAVLDEAEKDEREFRIYEQEDKRNWRTINI